MTLYPMYVKSFQNLNLNQIKGNVQAYISIKVKIYIYYTGINIHVIIISIYIFNCNFILLIKNLNYYFIIYILD